jgi:hypothetical protein
MAQKEIVTIIGCQRKYSFSASDWQLGFEGAASKTEIKAKVRELLKRFHHVKAFAGGKCVAWCSRSGREFWGLSGERSAGAAVRASFVNGGRPDSSRRRH